MKLSIGIVGLPNVGKSTLFNALLKKQVADAANYPFCTIEPNVGVVEVPDERLPVLAKIVKTTKIIPAVVEFYDIAGLVKGASKGEGLGNKFLSHIREVAAIVHVVRLFEDEKVVHVANRISPQDDIAVINEELILADLETLNKQKEPRMNAGKEERHLYQLIILLKEKLNQGIPARNVHLTDDEKQLVKPLNLLTLKPVLYVFNVSETQLENRTETEKRIRSIVPDTNHYLYLNAKLENDVLALPETDQKAYLRQYHLEDTGLNRLIKQSYALLGLISYLTGGEKEVRAWTITKGTSAPEAAGAIHSDFIKHFIKADIVPYADFVAAGGWVKAREQGKVQSVGRDYVMEDNLVVEFKIGVT
ncbi:redox-regulated ATPase YchF [Patescibacteria group bacterium]|nr:redox-regulated ATPase YchF [Patescibacteria group bacterium]MCL5091972.1 redox-regulated ATPase YchF [Patescibacteria group bacterium]